ncbi:GTPase [Croceivirga thetidis]|uniref:GTPase n=1 Tax=Croceivirga thetidis TaxID=2721623 RepID=A0ABX1GMX1_9FLAO|nr:GTPase [Croceivirga thetidis]NKI30415.1 GTPase [Croceivirga thetidis]
MQKFLFVYNANSSTRNAILDSMHKIFSPKTYDCKLCEITYGVFTENRTWKKFRKESKHELVFLHKDEFTKTYASKFGYKFDFPIVLAEGVGGLEVLISTNELNQVLSVEELIALINERS